MEEIGPVEYMIVSFPGNRFTGEIAPALGKLVESNTIRIIDLAFVGKDEDGSVAAFELSDVDEDVRRGLDALGLEATGLLGEEDLMDAAEDLEPGSSAAMLLWEDVWAAELASAMRDAGGVMRAWAFSCHFMARRITARPCCTQCFIHCGPTLMSSAGGVDLPCSSVPLMPTE